MKTCHRWWWTLVRIITLCKETDVPKSGKQQPRPIEQPDVIIDTTTGLAEHVLMSIEDKPQIHYLIEQHETHIHLVFRLPNIDEIKAGAAHANIQCEGMSTRIAELETNYNEALTSLLGPDHHNVGEHADNKSPPDSRIPDLLLKIKKPTNKYGLPVLNQREEREATRMAETVIESIITTTTAPIYDDETTLAPLTVKMVLPLKPTTPAKLVEDTKPTTTSTTTTSTTTTSTSKTTTSTTPTTTPTTSTSRTTTTSTTKPTTTPTTTTSTTSRTTTSTTTVTDANSEVVVNGKKLIIHSITFNPTWIRQEAISLYTEALSNQVFGSTGQVQSKATPAQIPVSLTIGNNNIATMSSTKQKRLNQGMIYTLQGTTGDVINIINSREVMKIRATKLPDHQGPIRLQTRISLFEKTKFNWETGKDTHSMQQSNVTIEYSQKETKGKLKSEKVCYRSVTTERYAYAYCVILSKGVFLFKNDEVALTIGLSTSHNLTILIQIDLIWTKTSIAADKLQLGNSHSRQRRQLLLGGLGGMVTILGVERWFNKYSSSGENFKDLSQHMADLATNMESALEDEEKSILTMSKHVVQIDANEANLLCKQSELTVLEISNYILEKLQITLSEVQMLGRELKTRPERSRIGEQILKLCNAYNRNDKTICLYHTSTATLTDIEHNGTGLTAKIVLQTPVSELEKRKTCQVLEQLTLPKLEKDIKNDLTLVETLQIPHRIKVECKLNSYYYLADSATILSANSILLKLSAAPAALECNPRITMCQKNQFSSERTCQRTLYKTIDNKEFIGISSTTPVQSNEFSTLKSHGIHGKQVFPNSTAHHIRVYNRKSNVNIQITCGSPTVIYNIHRSQNPTDLTIWHLSNNTGNENGMKTLQDIFKEEINMLQLQQKRNKLQTDASFEPMLKQLQSLNKTKNEFVTWASESLSLWPPTTAHWVGLASIIVALVIVVCLATKTYRKCRHCCHCHYQRGRENTVPIRRVNNRLSKIYRTTAN